MQISKFRNIFIDRMIWFILLIVFFVFSVQTDSFLTSSNFENILIGGAVLGLLTIGQSIVLISGNIDLSAEGNVSLLTVIAALLLLPVRTGNLAQAGGIGWELSSSIVVPVILMLGTIFGLVNGLIITKLHVNSFIITLAMQLVLRGFAYVLSRGAIMPGIPSHFSWLGSKRIGVFNASVLMTLFMFVLFGFILTKTKFGRELYATGGNIHAAKASGFNTDRIVIAAYAISGFLAGLASWVLLGRVAVSNATLGQGMTLTTVAAAVIGGASLNGGVGKLSNILAGVILLATIDNGLNLINIDSNWVNSVRGIIILFALMIEAQKVRMRFLERKSKTI